MRNFLGLSYFQWALVVWVGIAGTFAVIVLFRRLIAHRPEHEAFMSPAEIQRTLDNLRNVNRAAVGFGIASAATLILIAVARAVGLL